MGSVFERATNAVNPEIEAAAPNWNPADWEPFSIGVFPSCPTRPSTSCPWSVPVPSHPACQRLW